MASNPYVNRVLYGNTELLNLTQDTVDETKLLKNVTAHDHTGKPITGKYSVQDTQTYTVTDNGTYTINPSSDNHAMSQVSLQVSIPVQVYRVGSGAPADSLGDDGDLYFDIG